VEYCAFRLVSGSLPIEFWYKDRLHQANIRLTNHGSLAFERGNQVGWVDFRDSKLVSGNDESGHPRLHLHWNSSCMVSIKEPSPTWTDPFWALWDLFPRKDQVLISSPKQEEESRKIVVWNEHPKVPKTSNVRICVAVQLPGRLQEVFSLESDPLAVMRYAVDWCDDQRQTGLLLLANHHRIVLLLVSIDNGQAKAEELFHQTGWFDGKGPGVFGVFSSVVFKMLVSLHEGAAFIITEEHQGAKGDRERRVVKIA